MTNNGGYPDNSGFLNTTPMVEPVGRRAAYHCRRGVPDLEAMANPVIYLAHPYARKDMVETHIQPVIESLGIRVINPFQRAEQEIYAAALAPGGGGLTDEHCAQIVKMDLEKIDEANAVVALLLSERMIGTLMEIMYAYTWGKRIFSYAPNAYEQEHPWIRHLTMVCPGLSELVSELQMHFGR